ncbi:hypothetical protein QQY24_02045 [Streptomyces sp. TG1A-8]|uniref:hypothetical protein n=1 Tax=Streptomyces sp. TG1A-8 TaxID=3051385 RepID=UPI00265C3F26|nr:hypothetical protein [Streptomyces sp. TG1A-8]MDO0924252.1 hypothetical protein [Streptomyces sp. TG1A-8]
MPGQSAVFFLTRITVPVGDAPCPEATGFAFRPPLDPLADAAKTVAFPFESCGGTVRVSRILSASVTG